MNTTEKKSLWQILWDYDPNGMVVTDLDLNIQVTNPAFCKMFSVDPGTIIGTPITDIIDCEECFRTVWHTQKARHGVEKEYSEYDLYAREVIFPLPEEKLIAAILVDMTKEWKQKQQMNEVKTAAIEELSTVVDKQMHVAQQIAGLLGETTAETKVGLIKLLAMLKKDK